MWENAPKSGGRYIPTAPRVSRTNDHRHIKGIRGGILACRARKGSTGSERPRRTSSSPSRASRKRAGALLPPAIANYRRVVRLLRTWEAETERIIDAEEPRRLR